MSRSRFIDSRGGEGWLVSYCDMVSLLVTFFMLMMTFSTREDGDLRVLGLGLLRGRGGIWKPLETGAPIEADSGVLASLARDLERWRAQSGDGVAFEPALDGLLVHFDLAASFEVGSAEVPPVLRDRLRELARVLASYDFELVVEGSTDAQFQPSERFATAERLGAARACGAAEVLLRSGALAPERVQICGLGSERPRAPEDTEAGRASNRRVEIRILARSHREMERLER
jgi:chemotaxis protein MotB